MALNFSLTFLSREKEEKSFFIIFAPIKTNTMPKNRIYLCLAHMSEAGLEQKYIKEAFDTKWVVPLGPNVNGFEKDLEDFVNGSSVVERYGRTSLQNEPLQKHVVALSAGTAAVHLALIACGVKPGDEVCVQSFTFCASSHPITYLGATPVFIDSEPDSWNMDPDLLEKAIQDRIAKTGKKPKAIVPVALYGMPYDVDRIMEIAERYDRQFSISTRSHDSGSQPSPLGPSFQIFKPRTVMSVLMRGWTTQKGEFTNVTSSNRMPSHL